MGRRIRTVHVAVTLALFILVGVQAFDAWGENSIGLIRIGETPVNLESVKQYLVNELLLDVVVLDPVKRSADGLKDELARLRGQKPDEVFLLIGYAGEAQTAEGLLLADPEAGVAVVNLDAIQTQDGNEERVRIRLQKLSMRAVGNLLELPESPNPRCVMSRCPDLAALDGAGRNYSPPTQLLLRRALRERGIAQKEFY